MHRELHFLGRKILLPDEAPPAPPLLPGQEPVSSVEQRQREPWRPRANDHAMEHRLPHGHPEHECCVECCARYAGDAEHGGPHVRKRDQARGDARGPEHSHGHAEAAGHDHPHPHRLPHEHPQHVCCAECCAQHESQAHAHAGAFTFTIDGRQFMAHRLNTDRFMTHELPFVTFASMEDLAKAVATHLEYGVSHGRPKESK